MISSIGMYLSILLLPATFGIVMAFMPIPDQWRRRSSISLCCISCAAGIMAYPIVLFSDLSIYHFPIESAWGSYSVAMTELSAIMITFSSFVFLTVMIHMFRSGSAPSHVRYPALACLLFISCTLAMCADSVFLILIAWEMVTLITFMMAYSGREGPRWRFFVIAHLGGLMVISAFITMFVYAGTPTLSSWSDLSSSMGPAVSCGVVLLLFMGFGTKLGLVPFHVWMPDLYADAPTHTTTLLTTVCSNVAILILFRSTFEYIGMTDVMNLVAVLLIVISSISMIWGALESIIQTEAKRILAYSSMENMALVVLCMSVGMLFASDGYAGITVMILVAGLLHTINHSVFKALMLMTVGTVEDSTGTSKMEKLGGLSKYLPLLSMVALVSVLSMAAIPPFNGFMSEWLFLQSVMNGDSVGIGELELILPVVVAVLGVSGMLVAVSYARMYGFIFLGRPRSDAVHEFSPLNIMTIAPLVALAVICLALGLFAAPLINVLAKGMHLPGFDATDDVYSDYLMTSFDLPLLALFLGAMILILYALNKMFKKNVAESDTWGCGEKLNDDMQYSPMGFTQPLVKVFHPLYGDVTEIVDDKSHQRHFTVKFKEPFITYLYVPVGRAIHGTSMVVGRMQNGNIQTYLGYILVTLIVMLMAVRFL